MQVTCLRGSLDPRQAAIQNPNGVSTAGEERYA